MSDINRARNPKTATARAVAAITPEARKEAISELDKAAKFKHRTAGAGL